jgi:predicted ATPase
MLKKLELHNFKSHRQTQFDFDDSRLQAIVGQNSSGKTSVLQALYCSSILSQPPNKYLILKELMDAMIENATVDERDMIVAESGFLGCDIQNTWRFSCEFILQYNSGYWESKRNWIYSEEEITLIGSENPSSSIIVPEDLRSIIYLKLTSTNLSKAAYSEEIIPKIEFDGSGLAPTLDYLQSEDPDRFQSIQEMLQQIVPSVKKIGVRRAKVKIDRQRSIEVDGKSIVYEENQEVTGQEIVLDMNTGDRIPAHAISEGTMLTLGLLTVLMNPKQPNLVLLDDIEQGLHPKAQRELITVFKQIIQANPNLQIIFTTHSPYIIDELEPSQVHVLSNSKAGFTHAKRLDEHPDAEWAKQTLTTGEFWNAEGEDWVVDGDVND